MTYETPQIIDYGDLVELTAAHNVPGGHDTAFRADGLSA